MTGGSVKDFFSFLDRQNNAIAAREAKSDPDTGVGVDRLQVQQMDEHRAQARAKGYEPGAKPRARSRPTGGRIVRGYMENPEAGNR